jgi:acyl-coenzyme A synthetase/AMP-(fatty) acid ligase/acyl carrier protein
MLPHRAVVNYLRWMQSAYPLDGRDCVLQKAPVSFDASVLELYTPLVAGARLLLARPDGHREPLYLLSTIATHGATVVQFVPSLLAAIIETPGFAAAFASVRLLFLGGEALPGDLAARVRALLPHAAVHNLYGPTEAAVYATAHAVTEADGQGTVPIGRPIANAQVHVLSPAGAPVPVGVTGELYIGGAGVGAGYLNRSELTAARFVRDPFRDVPGAALYRTGDLARWRADGVLEFLGRADEQVKVRGFRVELGEIESALARCPGVRECAVAQRPAAAGGTRLVGYIVPSAGAAIDPALVRERLAATLPEHMVPAAFVTLDQLPLGVTGKLDRRALPEPAMEETRAYVPPRTPLEETVARVWAEVLELERVSVEDDFFGLGGHSLSAMRILVRLGSSTGLQLPMRTIFDARTVRALAGHIERERARQDETSEMEQMLSALEQLTDEEAARLLTTHPTDLVTE